ncbi:MAG TPA: nucleotide pyrophosphatase/phosphodiesterase family protein [Candidatus Saccharimonadales bacterium]|nr:nucleotide pyrophosphatase/phosphodiesterase family protein [Candidatus Saccharimonadales bacterium]
MNRTAVLNIVGLTGGLLGPAMPNLSRFAREGRTARVRAAFPAVTCTAQSNYLTGQTPAHHGIVANGWYNREQAEVQFWKQSNRLVEAPKIWDRLRAADPAFTCAQLFWWFNMYSTVDYSITPRPAYPADGRKVFDIYTSPATLRPEIKHDLGEFPFAAFWGPAAGVNTPQGSADAASRWIAEAAKWIERRFSPTLSLVYLPHLDYNLQRHGPNRPTDLAQIDAIAGELITFFQSRGVRLVLLSEYGLTPVDAPIHLNRLFREKGWIALREELGLELLDCGASKVFAVADHQVAHIYVNDPSLAGAVRDLLEAQPGIESVLGQREKAALGLDHPRAGDLVAVAAEHAWFSYYYWMDNALAPDFARCVDIHRKPGYDPVELFLDPNIRCVKLKILARLLKKRLGFRMLMDVIPLDATLVKGSHGRRVATPAEQPLILCDGATPPLPAEIDSTEVAGLIMRQIQDSLPPQPIL